MPSNRLTRSELPHSELRGAQSPRWLTLLLAAATCCTSASCAAVRNPFRSSGPPAPEVLQPGASLQQVMAAVNQNSARVRNYQTDNASITVPGMLGVPMLTGKIRAMRPGRLHLQASTSITGPEVDLGANDELFWFWVRRNQPPALYFGRHAQFRGSAAQQALPIEPQWLLDALGFAEFKPTDHHEGPVPHGKDTLEIRSVVNGPSGRMTKSTVVDAKRAWILEQHIYAPDGRILATAVARSHRFHPAAGVSLPQKIEVSMPAAELSLTIDVGSVQINTLVDNPQLWALPAMAGFPQVDLGGAPPGAAGALGRQLGAADWQGPAPAASVAALPPIAPPQAAPGAIPPGIVGSGSFPPAAVPAPAPTGASRLAPQTPLLSTPAAVGSPEPGQPGIVGRLPAGGAPTTLSR